MILGGWADMGVIRKNWHGKNTYWYGMKNQQAFG